MNTIEYRHGMNGGSLTLRPKSGGYEVVTSDGLRIRVWEPREAGRWQAIATRGGVIGESGIVLNSTTFPDPITAIDLAVRGLAKELDRIACQVRGYAHYNS